LAAPVVQDLAECTLAGVIAAEALRIAQLFVVGVDLHSRQNSAPVTDNARTIFLFFAHRPPRTATTPHPRAMFLGRRKRGTRDECAICSRYVFTGFGKG